ncbi:uncharacterized protein BJ171DRAFT_499002 [Polychytrium aggregatum]|uniref:uncharacterized protein n=1 Tax=Polychytrium aggregatum TaxID=110093 RepID=UPI0022FEDB52|nr:uncharacterized protein BJ171DRAFT_499002 [Polychytrium aggregatum]KAI9206165.1 hypothetical protein BJ171DRAFT_499002 [Polychytrium aggregatum]
MPASTETMAESSLDQGGFSRFDLLTVLITNETFIRAASLPLLTKLLRVSKRTRAILSTDQLQKRLWFDYLHITTEFLFQGVSPSVNRHDVMQGLRCYVFRQNQRKPTSPSMLEKENKFWFEVYRDRQLFNRVQRYCQVTDPEFRLPEDPRSNGLEGLSVQEMVAVAEIGYLEFQWLIKIEEWNRLTIRPNERRAGSVHVSKLLPFDIPRVDVAMGRKMTVEDVSFLEVSGWPKWLSSIQNLTVKYSYREQTTDLLISLEGLPKELPRLRKFDLRGCSQLASLKGMPEMPMLETLQLPKSIKSPEGIPKELPSLTTLDLSGCSQLTSLKELPEMPMLETLQLPKSIESLEGIPRKAPMLTRLDLSKRSQLKSLEEISEMPQLEILRLPESLESLEDMPKELPSFPFSFWIDLLD